MKINKYLCGLAVGVSMLFASCNTDNMGAEFDGTSAGQGITFAAAKLTATAVQASNPQFQIPIYRSNIIGDYTGSVAATGTIDGEAADCFSVSGFTFKSGEAKADITVDVSALEIGKVLELTLAYTDSTNMNPTNIEKVTVNVSVEYTWQSLGTGTFVDAWATGSDANPDGVVAKVEILKAEGFDRYRVVKPYAEYLASPQGAADWDNWISLSSTVQNLDIWIEDGLAFYEDFPLGLNYQGDSTQPIYGCHPWGWSSMQDPSFWAHNKMEGKTIQLAPYYYIDGVGGWNYTQYDGVILITLP